MTRALAARCLALLGPFDGPLAILGPRAARVTTALPADVPVAVTADETPGAALVTFLGANDGPAARQALLAGLRRRLEPGAPLLVVDHNQPRSWWRRAVGVIGLVARGLPPSRARYPTARELAVLGLEVERLRLGCGERVQLVAARTAACGPAGEQVEIPGRGRWR